jgi:hypothetical protein
MTVDDRFGGLVRRAATGSSRSAMQRVAEKV